MGESAIFLSSDIWSDFKPATHNQGASQLDRKHVGCNGNVLMCSQSDLIFQIASSESSIAGAKHRNSC